MERLCKWQVVCLGFFLEFFGFLDFFFDYIHLNLFWGVLFFLYLLLVFLLFFVLKFVSSFLVFLVIFSLIFLIFSCFLLALVLLFARFGKLKRLLFARFFSCYLFSWNPSFSITIVFRKSDNTLIYIIKAFRWILRSTKSVNKIGGQTLTGWLWTQYDDALEFVLATKESLLLWSC